MNEEELKLILTSLLTSLEKLDNGPENLTEEELKDTGEAFKFLEDYIQSNSGNISQSHIPLLEKVSLRVEELYKKLSNYTSIVGEETDRSIVDHKTIETYTKN